MKKEEKEQVFVSVDSEYLDELKQTAETSEWRRGYIVGVEDGIKYAVMILQASGLERSSE